MAKRLPILHSETFLNWLKLGLAIHYTKKGIEPLVYEDAEQIQQEILKDVCTHSGVSSGTTCSSCSIENLIHCPTRDFCKGRSPPCSVHCQPGKQYRACPNNICDKFVEKIRLEHRFSKPSWKNVDAERWCTEPVELAKCFMPRDGYSGAVAFKDIDFNGVVNVIINNKRLQAKFADDLTKSSNVATQAREVGKAFRHSPDLGIDRDAYIANIDDLVNLLSDIKYPLHQKKAHDAITTISELKDESFSISSSDATQIIEDFIRSQSTNLTGVANKQMVEMAAHGDCLRRKMQESQKAFLCDVADAVKDINILTADSLQNIISSKICAIGEIKDIAIKEKKAVIKERKHLKRKALKHKKSLNKESKRLRMSMKKEKENAVADLRRTATSSRALGERISESEDYPKLKNELRNDLIQLCRKQHANLPVSPVREKNGVPLLPFYVAPTLKCKEYEKGQYMKENIDKSRHISSYHDVFFHQSKECQDVYLASPAGTGKTSYVKRMALAWCFSHSPDEEQKMYFTEEEVKTMKDFDFVFLLSMRETSQLESHVDEMIKSQVIEQFLSYMYSDDFLQEILHTEKCLILIDGLDEWTHPNIRLTSSIPLVPERKIRKKCTILTTARPWKVEAVINSKCFIDQHIEMIGLEETSANKLITNALDHLNDRYSDTKSSEDFTKLLKENRLHKLKSIPLILLQLLCLWFSNGRLGDSRCEIYSNMLEFLFRHAKNRSSYPVTRSKTKMKRTRPTDLPKSFLNCSECHVHKDLLMSLGKLAFEGLFGIRPESSLLFSETVVQGYLNTSMLKICKETGILSQNKFYRNLMHSESNYSFIHKTYQEFLAALYISARWSQKIEQQIFSFCSSTEHILQASNIFVFESGINQDVASDIAKKSFEIVANDEGTKTYRRNIGTLFIKSRHRMHRLHTVMINCLQESYDNGFERVSALAQDVFINSKCKLNWLLEKRAIDRNMNNIRSLDIQSEAVQEQVHEMLHSLDVKSLNGLEKLYVWGRLPTEDIAIVIQSSSQSLICLELWHMTFTDDLLCAIRSLDKLEGISLLSVTMSHTQIESLMEFLNQTNTLRQLSLNEVKCLDHGQFCNGYTLNLPESRMLEMLLLDKLYVTKIDVNPQKLTMCVVEWLHKDGALSSLLNGLRNSSNLVRFECDGTENPEDLDALVGVLATLVSLKYVKLRNIKLGDRYLDLSTCESLECIYMWRVNVNSYSLKQLLDKIKSHARDVTVMLEGCDINPAEDYERLKHFVEESDAFEVTRDTNFSNKYSEFYFKTALKSD